MRNPVTSAEGVAPVLVLGLGNVLLGDDGLGVEALRAFTAEWIAPDDLLILDGGTLGLSLLPYLEDARSAILVDAVRADAPAGSLVRLADDDVAPAVAHRLSVHQVGVADLLDAARLRGRLPERVVLLGLVPESIELRVGLSKPVVRGLPGLVAEVAAEAAALGAAPARRRPHDTSENPPPGLDPVGVGARAVL